MLRRFIRPIVISLVCVLALGGFIYRASVFRPMRNFHEIDPGKFYRSAQPSADELSDEVRQYGIKTVINLRGSQPGEWWYDAEATRLKELGVKQIDLSFSTEHMQFKNDWVAYLDALKTAERPILVHCRSGADRTSEATAVYAMEYMGKPKGEAIKYVNWRYLHVSFLQPAKRVFVENYGGDNWVRNEYDPCKEPFFSFAGNRCPKAAIAQ